MNFIKDIVYFSVTVRDKFQLIGWVYLPLKYKFTASRAKKSQYVVFLSFSDEFRMQTSGVGH